MARQQNTENSQSSIRKEIGTEKRANPSTVVVTETVLPSSKTAANIRPRKDLQADVIDDGLVTGDGNVTTGAAAEAEQPLIMAQVASSQPTPANGSIVADNQHVLLADASGAGNGSGQAVSTGDAISDSRGAWWALGGVAVLGAGLGIAAANDDDGWSGGAVNEAPVISSNGGGATASISVTENQTVVTTVTATDVNVGDGRTFSISGGADAARFQIDAATGGLTFVAAPNYEAPADAGGNNVYDVQVTVTDTAGLTDVQDIVVTVTGVNDNPVSAISDSTVAVNSVAENAANGAVVGITALATDADAGATISYSLSDNAGGRFAINSSSGVISVADGTLLDYEAATSHAVTVLATSSDGSSNSQSFTINLTNVNDNPVSAVSDSNVAVNSVAENAPNGTAVGITALATDADAGATLSYSLSDNAGGRFAINSSSGVISVADGTLLDYEAATSHAVTVLATSSDGSSNSQSFTINLTNVNDNVVVEASGAWIDLDADGVLDAADTIAADFTAGTGNVDLTANAVTIHFNDLPNGDLNLAGFGADDLIQIDVQAFIDNGHYALNILAIPEIKTLDEFKTAGGSLSYAASSISNPYSSIVNTHTAINNFIPSISASRQTGTQYRNTNIASGVTTPFWASIGLELRSNASFTQRNLRFFSSSTSASANGQLASGLPTDIPLQDMVDFVNLPVQPATVHVIVERGGAVIDIDGDGVRDNGENRLAIFAPDGNAELATNSVVIHFNDIPQYALDLTGFGTDDKIEFDIQALQGNNIFNSTATQLRLSNISTLSGTTVGVRYAFNSTPSSPLRLTVVQMPDTFTTVNWGTRSNEYALRISTMWTSINGRWSGAFAYWTDSGNALNDPANILPGYPSASTSAVLATLNSNAPHVGLVDFVWPVNVVVDDEAGNLATFIDVNANGVRDGGEDTLALLGQTQADVDAFNAAAGTSYGSQAVDLASEQVTIHYNDLPTGTWMPDLTGFDGNDRIAIDINAMRFDSDGATLNNQPTRTMGGQTQYYDGVSGVSSGNTAVYLSGSNLIFGHRTTTITYPAGGGSVWNTHYTAPGSLEGAIASNIGPLANHFQQVVFVTSIV